MNFVLDGIKVGCILAIMLGPAFFAMTQKTIERNTLSGILLAAGVWISDLIYIAASFFAIDFLTELNKSESFEFWLGIIGCIILVAFGIASIITSNKPIKKYKSNSFLPFLEGFSINTFNPFNVFFWLTVTTTLITQTNNFRVDAVYFYSGVLIAIITTDLLKILFARRIKRILTDKHIVIMKKISGLALIVFGIIVLLKSQHLI